MRQCPAPTGQIETLQGGLWPRPLTAEKRVLSLCFSPSFSLKHLKSWKALLLFELSWESEIGFFQFSFTMYQKRFEKQNKTKLGVGFSLCFALRGHE